MKRFEFKKCIFGRMIVDVIIGKICITNPIISYNFFAWILLYLTNTFSMQAQVYNYTNESFEGTTWPTTVQTTSVSTITGSWSIVKGYTSSAKPAADGAKYLVFDNSGTSVQMPNLNAGAGLLSFEAYAIGNGNRTITVSTSIDGVSFSDIFTTPELSTTEWEKFTLSIRDINVKYIKLSNSGGGVAYDALFLTPYSFKVSSDTISGFKYIKDSGPSAVNSFTISALNLISGNSVNVTASTGFEVSVDGINWSKTAVIPNVTGGTLPLTILYSRMVSGLNSGDYNGTIVVSGGGKPVGTTIIVSGLVAAAETSKCSTIDLLTPSRKENFGTFLLENGRSCASGFYIDPTAFKCATGSIGDTYYSVVAQSSVAGGWAVKGPDHTIDPAGTFGGMLLVNSGNTSGKVVYRREWPVCTGVALNLSAYYADANNHSNASYIYTPGITFNVYGGNTAGNVNNLIVKRTQPPIPLVVSEAAIWNQINVPFNTGTYAFIKLEITNDVDQTQGNDILIDDIELKAPPMPIEACVKNAKCNGICDAEITLSRVNGNGNYRFELDGVVFNGTSASFTGICAGLHTLKVSDLSGNCDILPNITFEEPPKLIVTPVFDPNCVPGAGTIGLVASGGTPGYQYRKGSGAWVTNSVFTGLSNGVNSFSVKDVNNCQINLSPNLNCILPLKWISFTGEKIEGRVVLNWRINGVLDNSFFVVERSFNGLNFEEIGTVKRDFNNSLSEFYQFADNNPKEGKCFYRIKEFLGSDEKSSTKTILVNNYSNSENVEVYPNPTKGSFTINLQSYQQINKMEVFDVNGKIVYVSSNIYTQTTVNLAAQYKGVFFLRFYMEEETTVQKLILH